MLRILREELAALDHSPRALRRFGLVVGGVLLVVAGVIVWRHGAPGPAAWTLAAVGTPLVVVGLARPTLLHPVYVAWMSLALVLGFVMTRVVLTLVFFLVVTPIGLVFRVLGKDLLHRRPDDALPTYWQAKTYDDDTPARLERYY